MRNVSEDTEPASYEKGWIGKTGWYEGKSSLNTLQGNQLILMRGRSGVIQSDGINPTAYNAYSVSASARGFQAAKPMSSKYGTYDNVAHGTKAMGNPQLLAVGLGGPPSWLPQVNGALKARARTQALNKLTDGKMDLGETLGDIRQTGQMMARNLAALAVAMKHTKNGNFGAAANVLGLTKSKRRSFGKSAKAASSNWLALQFGWLPLMSDIYNGHAAINKAMDDGDTYLKVKATAVGGKSMPFFSGLSYSGKLEEGCQVGITMIVSNNTASGLNQLNLINPLSIAWQVASLSFVVDWFVSVGDYLSALGADIGLQFVAGYETYFVKGKNIELREDVDQILGILSSGTYPAWKVSVFAMQRVVLQSPPPPGLYMKLGLDLGKSATAVALLTQRAR